MNVTKAAASGVRSAFRVATYNIRKCVGLDWRRRPGRIKRVLAELDADVVALQEADRRFGPRLPTLSPDELRNVTGLRIVPLNGPGAGHGWHGNALLVSDRVAVRRTSRIDLPSLEPRGAVMADLEIDGAPLRVTGVHLGLRAADRRRQARSIVDTLLERTDRSSEIVLGDFNEWRRDKGCLTVFQERLRPVSPQPSFHTAAPFVSFDRVFLGGGLQVVDSGVHRSDTARVASDHLPLWANLHMKDPGDADRHDQPACDDGQKYRPRNA